MVICLTAYKVLKTGRGAKLIHAMLVPEFKYPHKFDFGFDISDYNKTQKFLSEWRFPDGKLLPTLSKDGFALRYRMYRMGGYPAYVNLYPGYDEHGVKRAVWQHGVLKR